MKNAFGMEVPEITKERIEQYQSNLKLIMAQKPKPKKINAEQS